MTLGKGEFEHLYVFPHERKNKDFPADSHRTDWSVGGDLTPADLERSLIGFTFLF